MTFIVVGAAMIAVVTVAAREAGRAAGAGGELVSGMSHYRRVVAVGRRAEWLTEGLPWDHAFGPGQCRTAASANEGAAAVLTIRSQIGTFSRRSGSHRRHQVWLTTNAWELEDASA